MNIIELKGLTTIMSVRKRKHKPQVSGFLEIHLPDSKWKTRPLLFLAKCPSDHRIYYEPSSRLGLKHRRTTFSRAKSRRQRAVKRSSILPRHADQGTIMKHVSTDRRSCISARLPDSSFEDDDTLEQRRSISVLNDILPHDPSSTQRRRTSL